MPVRNAQPAARKSRIQYLDEAMDDVARVPSPFGGFPRTRMARHVHHEVGSVTASGACVDCGSGPCRWNLLGRLRNPCMVPHNA